MRLTKGLGHPTLLPENFGRHSGQAQREPESSPHCRQAFLPCYGGLDSRFRGNDAAVVRLVGVPEVHQPFRSFLMAIQRLCTSRITSAVPSVMSISSSFSTSTNPASLASDPAWGWPGRASQT